jgi:hypothetical protein
MYVRPRRWSARTRSALTAVAHGPSVRTRAPRCPSRRRRPRPAPARAGSPDRSRRFRTTSSGYRLSPTATRSRRRCGTYAADGSASLSPFELLLQPDVFLAVPALRDGCLLSLPGGFAGGRGGRLLFDARVLAAVEFVHVHVEFRQRKPVVVAVRVAAGAVFGRQDEAEFVDGVQREIVPLHAFGGQEFLKLMLEMHPEFFQRGCHSSFNPLASIANRSGDARIQPHVVGQSRLRIHHPDGIGHLGRSPVFQRRLQRMALQPQFVAFGQVPVLGLGHRLLAIVATAPPVLKYASKVSLFQPVNVYCRPSKSSTTLLYRLPSSYPRGSRRG